jgi:hypothetical protein
MLEEHRLHLSRCNRKAFVFDHLFLAIDDVDIAFAVHAGNIARCQPTIAQDPGRFLGRLPVALHDMWPFDVEFTDLPHLQLPFPSLEIDDLLFLIGHCHTHGVQFDAPLPFIHGIQVRHR